MKSYTPLCRCAIENKFKSEISLDIAIFRVGFGGILGFDVYMLQYVGACV